MPCSFKIAAAALESTPPLIATAIFITLKIRDGKNAFLLPIMHTCLPLVRGGC
jgi:hypothetical protein